MLKLQKSLKLWEKDLTYFWWSSSNYFFIVWSSHHHFVNYKAQNLILPFWREDIKFSKSYSVSQVGKIWNIYLIVYWYDVNLKMLQNVTSESNKISVLSTKEQTVLRNMDNFYIVIFPCFKWISECEDQTAVKLVCLNFHLFQTFLNSWFHFVAIFSNLDFLTVEQC